MLKHRALLLLSLCLSLPAQAGLLEDDEARRQIQQVEARVQKLEEAVKQQTKSMLDLQSQIEALNMTIRNLRGQNEEIAHGLQDAEKRQKDFYVDLDTRVRHFEVAEEAAKEAVAAPVLVPATPSAVDPSDPGPANRSYEAAYGLSKSGNHADAVKAFQDFLKKYPGSVYAANANWLLGNAQYALKDYRGALDTYQALLKDFPGTAKAADVLYGMAGCEQGLKRPVTARKLLKQIIDKYPSSEAAAKAKKLLAAGK